jgi:hypothetical protein
MSEPPPRTLFRLAGLPSCRLDCDTYFFEGHLAGNRQRINIFCLLLHDHVAGQEGGEDPQPRGIHSGQASRHHGWTSLN